jgi:Tfp pilus assembly protein PilF
VLRLDPRHGPAGNDLGYTWADAGRNLQRAEELIRMALEQEPDNAAFLDSMGWVLYKRGRFEEAKGYLRKAADGMSDPDPVVLDHLADVLYRLGQAEEAARLWQQAQQSLEEMPQQREDLARLRVQLKEKLQQQREGQPVDVAPVAETDQARQAKN